MSSLETTLDVRIPARAKHFSYVCSTRRSIKFKLRNSVRLSHSSFTLETECQIQVGDERNLFYYKTTKNKSNYTLFCIMVHNLPLRLNLFNLFIHISIYLLSYLPHYYLQYILYSLRVYLHIHLRIWLVQ